MISTRGTRTIVLGLAILSLVCGRAEAQLRQSLLAARTPVAPADSGPKRSSLFSAVEITGFLAGLSVFDRIVYASQVQDGKKVYSATLASTWDHLTDQTWVHDQDPFNVNQFAHPYQGATMYGLARSGGHRFWSSLAQADVGSFVWKMAGETDPPSLNDMITTGQAGSLLGEALYRMADLVLKNSGGTTPSAWHEAAAALISPPAGLNRRVFGDRFDPQLGDTAPATIWQLEFGANIDALAHDVGAPATLLRRDATTDFSMSYGLPGKPGYDYHRPLDYFDFQFSVLANASNPIQNVMIRGLLFGDKTAESAHSRGIWGLYGTYDYISPYLFRVSNTAVNLGTTQQVWLSPSLVLQGTALGGVGYGAAGSTTVIASTPTNAAIRDYHFGVAPQALLALRLIAAERLMFDGDAREYYVSGLGSDDVNGSETIFRGSIGATLRVINGHALGVHYVASTRDARYGKQADSHFSEGTFTVAYSMLGASRFNATRWQ